MKLLRIRFRLSRSAIGAVMTAALLSCSVPESTGDDSGGGVEAAVHQPTASGEFSYDAYDALLRAYVNSEGRVQYKELLAHRPALDEFVESLGAIEPATYEGWTAHEQIALWINAYNAITLKIILDNYPIKKGSLIASLRYPANSIRQISGVWDKITARVMGKDLTLGHIEHEILRAEYNEPRIHVAIVCASGGCPPLLNEAFTGPKLEKQLTGQSRVFLSNRTKFRVDKDRRRVYISPIFRWFGQDFVSTYGGVAAFKPHGEKLGAVLNFISQYVSEKDAAYLAGGTYTVKYEDYDWSLNEQ